MLFPLAFNDYWNLIKSSLPVSWLKAALRWLLSSNADLAAPSIPLRRASGLVPSFVNESVAFFIAASS
jgi:hypothetical protein